MNLYYAEFCCAVTRLKQKGTPSSFLLTDAWLVAFDLSTVFIENISSKAEKFAIYPNPTTGIVYVDLNKVLQIEIPILFHLYNMAGKKVIEKQLHPGGVEIIQLDFLSAGIYVLSCMQEGVLLHTEKVVVE